MSAGGEAAARARAGSASADKPESHMNTMPHTAPAPAGAMPAREGTTGELRRRMGAVWPLARHVGLLFVIAVSAVLNTHRLDRNGYANVFYSAGVRSMLRSLHNFLFVSSDPGGLVTVDKPPLALWLQAASAKLFGFSPSSLLLPEAIVGVLTVAVMYVILARRLGPLVATGGALAVAVFPSFVAVSRDNGVDPLLILFMTLAAGAAIRACENGRWRWVLTSGVMVGLAFNTKTLAAYLVVPGILAALAVCAPGGVGRRVVQIACFGAVALAVSFSWIAYVEATPASQRPYVGGSTDNTEWSLTFGYNGFGRVEGQNGGPGDVKVLPGARVPLPKPAHPHRLTAAQQAAISRVYAEQHSTYLPNGRLRNSIPFGSRPSPVRLFGKGLGDQDGWLVPLALFGAIALAVLLLTGLFRSRSPGAADEPAPAAAGPAEATPTTAEDVEPVPPAGDAAARAGDGAYAPIPSPRRFGLWRRDPRVALAIVLGGWFAVETVVLSFSKGIVHPYYVSALAPATGAMAGAGAWAILRLRHERPIVGMLLAAFAVIGTVAVQILLMHREQWWLWFEPFLIAGAVVGLGLMFFRRLAPWAVMGTFLLLLVAPAAYSATTWYFPVEGTFAAAGPKAAGGDGGIGASGRQLAVVKALLDYTRSHRPSRRFALLTVASDTSAPYILLGYDASALGGYSGIDPVIDGRGLARLVRVGEARWVLLGGVYSTRGGNAATKAVLKACREVPASVWKSPDPYPTGLNLFDCAGRERALEAAG